MRRREFIAGLAAAVVAQRSAAGQQRLPVVGFLNLGSSGDKTRQTFLAAFRRGLTEAGYIEGRNVAIEYRWAEGRDDILPSLAAELVRREPAVIAAVGGTQAALAAKAATSSVPIVFQIGSDPVEFGLVASIRRPGSNLTGVTSLSEEIVAKRLELLHEFVPGATSIALLASEPC
jgi:putative ABC transport system substrate-binding protein